MAYGFQIPFAHEATTDKIAPLVSCHKLRSFLEKLPPPKKKQKDNLKRAEDFQIIFQWKSQTEVSPKGGERCQKKYSNVNILMALKFHLTMSNGESFKYTPSGTLTI